MARLYVADCLMTRQVNKAGLDLIKSFEGLRLEAYPDPGTGGDPWTVGYGSTKGVKKGMKITVQEAEQRLIMDLQDACKAVERYVTIPLNDNQFAALVSFTFNVGAGNLAVSTLLKRLNEGEYGSVPMQLMRWNRAAGKILNGLTRRRTAEGDLFQRPV